MKMTKRRQPYRIVEKFWDQDDVEQLITKVRFSPCLWNSTLPESRDRKYRMNKWQLISDSFCGRFSLTDCTSKWQCLRSTYRNVNNLQKNQEPPEDGTKPEPKWKYFKSMSFLNSEDSDEYSISSNMDIDPLKGDETMFNNNDNTPDSSDCPKSGSLKRSYIKTHKNEINDHDHNTIKSDIVNSSLRVINASSYPLSTTQKSSDSSRLAAETINVAIPNDNAQIFANFIASQLRDLPSAKAKVIQRKLARVLFNMLDELDADA